LLRHPNTASHLAFENVFFKSDSTWLIITVESCFVKLGLLEILVKSKFFSP
jgi:hypothetical protein